MAIFLGQSARLWSRYILSEGSTTGFGPYLWAEYACASFAPSYAKCLQMAVNPGFTKIAYNTNHVYYVSIVITPVAYTLADVPYDRYQKITSSSQAYCWWSRGASDSSGTATSNVTELVGLTPTDTAYPEWRPASKPGSFSDDTWRWVGEWSDDESVFASIIVNPADGALLLSVKQANNVTLSLRSPLGINHTTQKGWNDGVYKVDGHVPRVIVRAASDIWIFHSQNSTQPAYNGTIKLSIWNGSSIASTATLVALPSTSVVTSFDVVRGAGGYMYLTYTLYDPTDPGDPPNVNGRIYLRTLNEATKAVSAAISTPFLSDPYGSRYPGAYSHGRINSNRVFSYKGTNYIIAESSHFLAVFTYGSDPSVVTLLRAGDVPAYTSPSMYGQQWRRQSCGAFTAIEYDPITDTAYLAVVIPSTIEDLRPYDESPLYDTTVVRVTVHYQRLEDTTWAMSVALAAEIPSYPRDTSTTYTNRAKALESIGYVPSRVGSSRQGTLLLAYETGSSGSRTRWQQIIKVQLWSEPTIVDAFVSEIQAGAATTVIGSRDLKSLAVFDGPLSVAAVGLLRRNARWLSYYEYTQTSSVDGTVYVDLTPSVYAYGNLTERHEGSAAIDASIQVSVTGETISTTFLDSSYFYAGTGAIDSFVSLLNDARAAAGVLPIQAGSTYRERSLDILRIDDVAQKHSDTESRTKRYAHGSSVFPAGRQQTHQRLARIASSGAEGLAILVVPVERESVDLSTAMAECLGQMLADTHYGAALLADLSDKTDGALLHLAYSVGPHPTAKGGGEPFDRWAVVPYPTDIHTDPLNLTIYVTCLLFTPKGFPVDTSFSYAWQVDALGLRLLEHSWETVRVVHAVAQHTSENSFSMHAEHVSVYLNRVVAAHTAESTKSVVVSFEIDFTRSQPVPTTTNLSLYELSPLVIISSNELLWSHTLAAQHAADYGDTPTVSASLDALYQEGVRTNNYLVAAYGELVHVHKRHENVYALQTRRQHTHVTETPLRPRTGRAHESQYDLQARNTATRNFSAAYDLEPPASWQMVRHQPGATVSLNGRHMELDDGYISCDFDSPGYTFECQVADLSFLSGASIGDHLDVIFEGTPYVFFLANLSSTSAERSAAAKVTLRGLSPVFMLEAPYAETVTYAASSAKLFSEIIQESLGRPVDFSRHIDWVVPYGRAQSAAQTPLSLARTLLESVGSKLLSRPDGSLYATPRYPVGFDAIPTGVPPHALDETNNVFLRSYTYSYARGYNRFRIRDSEARYGDVIEFDLPASIITVRVSPYRSSWRLECTTTGILLDAQGETVEEKEELWDFQAGTTTAAYPILDLVSLTWVTDSLGGVSFEPYSTKVSAAVATNFGYGLAKVVYRTKCSRFKLLSSTPLDATQLIIVEL